MIFIQGAHSPWRFSVGPCKLKIKQNYLKNALIISNEFKNSQTIRECIVHKLLSFALKRDTDLQFLMSLSKLFQSLEA